MSKIKAIDPKIVVNGNIDKPYYSIEYYDTADNKWHIGYGSYELKNVIEWLKTDFDVIKADVAPVRHGRWLNPTKLFPYYDWKCSECGCEEYRQTGSNGQYREMNFCPNCGAKMKI